MTTSAQTHVRWQDVNLAVVKEWPERMLLGDERAARELAKQPLRDPLGLASRCPKARRASGGSARGCWTSSRAMATTLSAAW